MQISPHLQRLQKGGTRKRPMPEVNYIVEHLDCGQNICAIISGLLLLSLLLLLPTGQKLLSPFLIPHSLNFLILSSLKPFQKIFLFLKSSRQLISIVLKIYSLTTQTNLLYARSVLAYKRDFGLGLTHSKRDTQSYMTVPKLLPKLRRLNLSATNMTLKLEKVVSLHPLVQISSLACILCQCTQSLNLVPPNLRMVTDHITGIYSLNSMIN